MSPTDPREWSLLDRALDELLELEPGARAAALAAFGVEHPGLVASLEALLRADDAGPGVLDAGVAALAAGWLADADSPAPPEDEAPSIDRYRLLRLLGRGGMGGVWLAERTDGSFGRPVALKVLHRGLDSEELRRRFELEREILGRLEHPGVARLLDGGIVTDGRPYFAMEFVDGVAITAFADSRRLSLRERLRLFEEVCDVVRYAQQRLIVHRDLKPSNILVTPEGRVKLLDFGIAKLLAESEAARPGLTRAGLLRLTPEYAAPEQLRGEPVTLATDVYSLGLILFELLAGRRSLTQRDGRIALGAEPAQATPLAAALDRAPDGATGEPAAAAVARIAEARGTTSDALRRQLRGELGVIVDAALRAEPERRYASAAALLEDLQRLRMGEPLRARPTSARYRAGKYVRRHRVGVAAAAAAVLALSVGLAVALWQARVAKREAARASAVTEFLSGLLQGNDPDAAGPENPTARELLSRGAAQIDTAFVRDPELRAHLLSLIGGLHVKVGDYEAAVRSFGQALDLREGLHRPGHPSRREALIDLGSAHVQAMHLEQGDSLLRKASLLFESEAAKADPQWSRLLNDRASLERRRGDFEAAVELQRVALEVDRRHRSTDQAEIAIDLSNLGVLLADLGRHAEAESVHREVLAIRRSVLPAGHSTIPVTLHNLACALRRLDRPGAADSAFKEAIALRRRLHPLGHPLLVSTLREHGSHLAQRRRFDEADSVLSEAVAMSSRVFGEEHSEYARSINEYAVMDYRRGDLPAAAAGFARASELLQAALPPGHATTIAVQANLAGTLRRAGRSAEAARAEAKLERLRAVTDALQ